MDGDARCSHALLAALREPAALISQEGLVVAVNPAWEAASRRPDAAPVVTATVGASLPNRCRTAELSGFSAGGKIAGSIEDVLHGLAPELDAELTWTSAGVRRVYLLTVTPVREHGLGALVLHREITAQQLAQESLSHAWDYYLRVFDDFPALVFRFGEDGHASYFNRTAREFTGRSDAELRGNGWREVVHAADREPFERAVREAITHRRPQQVELRVRRRDGEYRWLVASGRPYSGLDESFGGYVWVANDITEARRAEALAIDARAAQAAAEGQAQRARADGVDMELGQFEAYRGGEETRAAIRTPELPPLFEQSPEVFEQLARRYGELMDLALERQTYRDVTASPSHGLRELGARLVTLHAGPRDVVELHARVLKTKLQGAGVERRQAYMTEGRLMALELMGNLAAYYRARASRAAAPA